MTWHVTPCESASACVRRRRLPDSRVELGTTGSPDTITVTAAEWDAFVADVRDDWNPIADAEREA